MVSELQHQIAEAVLAGVSLDAIEQEKCPRFRGHLRALVERPGALQEAG
jgi:hypothetical protein